MLPAGHNTTSTLPGYTRALSNTREGWKKMGISICLALSVFIFFSGDYFRVSEPVSIAFVLRSYRLYGVLVGAWREAHPEAQRTRKLQIPRAPRAAPSRISVDDSDIANRAADNISREFDRSISSLDTSVSRFTDACSSVKRVYSAKSRCSESKTSRGELPRFFFNTWAVMLLSWLLWNSMWWSIGAYLGNRIPMNIKAFNLGNLSRDIYNSNFLSNLTCLLLF